MTARWPLALLVALGATTSLWAQSVSGTVFEDRDADGVREAGETGLEGVTVSLFGRAGSAPVDTALVTGATGGWSFAPGDGCYLVSPADPPGWRLVPARTDGFAPGSPGYSLPVGRPRFAKLDHGIQHLRAGSLHYGAMGDSIAWNFNFCSYPESFWYAKRLRERLACANPQATVTLDQAAVKGQHTDDLLVDDTTDLNNVFRMIERQPDLVTLSMIGNDLLGVDPGAGPTQQEIDRAAAELLDSRRNLQEALSALLTALPDADITLNSLYDNETWNCYTGNPTDFHRAWLPIVNAILRDVAWGQVRRVGINEIRAEFAHEDQAGTCRGFDGLICRDVFGFDRIHPTNSGFSLILEKVWEAAGGLQLGPLDAQDRTSIGGVDHGYLRRVRRLLPTSWESRNGAQVASPDSALSDADAGATAGITLGAGSEELRLSGFPDWYDEVEIVRVIAGVRYRTTGTVVDDFYRMEASLDGSFGASPGHAFSTTSWNFVTPLVGGGGPSQPAQNPDYPTARVLALPNVVTPREVTALVSKNPLLPPGATDYVWPTVTHEDLASAAVRVVAAPVAATPGNDTYTVELDAAWLDLYGWERPRPAEVADLRVTRRSSGELDLTFLPVAGAERYNVYLGRLGSLAGAGYDHGADHAPGGPFCDTAVVAAAGDRLAAEVTAVPAPSLYLLVTAHADDVESPSGFDAGETEIDRSQSSCR